MESFGISAAICSLAFIGFSFLLKFLFSSNAISSTIPISGLRNEIFKTTRASFRQLTDGVSTLLDGYRKYSIHGKLFILCEPSLDQELMIPPEHIQWFAQLSDSIMSSKTIREERHASKYLHMGVEYESTIYFMERIIRDSLTRSLGDIQNPLQDEISRGFDSVFGDNSAEWTNHNAYVSMQKIILQAMCRVFFGEEISRNPRFLHTYSRYILAMGVGTMIIGMLPGFLKRIFVPVFNLPLWYYRRQTLKHLVPVVERQMAKGGTDEQSYDFISQCAKASVKSTIDKTVAGPSLLAEWMMLLGFAAFNSLGSQMAHILQDILHTDENLHLYEVLQEEAKSLLKNKSDWNDMANFNRMHILDSVIRESLRYHPMLIKGLTKEVVRKDGLDLPNGTHVPKGTWVGVPVLGIHRDDRYYPNPDSYDPFRYTKLREEHKNNEGEGSKPTNDLDAGKPSSTYLGFGYGRHACPGRWYAVLMMKIMLAYMVTNYDVEAIGPQPGMKVIGDAALPPISAQIKIRRREMPVNQ